MTWTGSKGNVQSEPFGLVYSKYPPEMRGTVTEAIRICHDRDKGNLSVEVICAQVRSMANTVIRYSWDKPAPEEHDAAHLARAAEAVRKKPDTLEDKIARCMTRKGNTEEEEREYQVIRRAVMRMMW